MPDAVISSMVDALPMPAVAIAREARIVAANAPALNLLGDGIEGRHFATALRQPQLLDAIEACLADRKRRIAQFVANERGQDVMFRVSLAPALFRPGEAPGLLVVFEDVTHLEMAGQIRRDFVANVSHELRTPLTALLGFIETLRGPARDDAAARERFLEIMEAEAGRMNRLVGDLLSLSRVEADERMRPADRVALPDLLRSTLRGLAPLAEEAGVTLHADLPAEAGDITVPGDEDQLRQVFTNLVENAIKYGGRGCEVTVRLDRTAHEPRLRVPGVEVTVADTGPGIDELHLPRLTERFYRVDNHRSREMGGTGLGLAIVKHILNRHRGRLRIESTPGQGSRFGVILPLD
ncbi:ATP-binding protein [Rhodosalinus sp. 5P4]|uniref:ATP-binding protein n=1 Tax=Rhodosalinus sp. 5P4 TaxID=3239196 RepID=UPI003525E636